MWGFLALPLAVVAAIFATGAQKVLEDCVI